jgi:hypothetical protein
MSLFENAKWVYYNRFRSSNAVYSKCSVDPGTNNNDEQ